MRFFNILFLAALVLCIQACVSDTKSQTQANKKLLIYTTFEHEQVKEYMDAFHKAYPDIETELIVDSHGIITAKILAQKDNPQADVIFGLSAINMEGLKELHLLSPLDIDTINDFQAAFRDKQDPPFYVGLTGVESAIIVNEKELAKKNLPIPQSYQDLTKPIYKNMITMSNPTSSGTGLLSILGWINLLGEEKAWDYMKQLDKNVALYTHSGSKPARMALTGEYPIGISLGYRGHKMLKDAQPITMIFAKEGYGWDLESIALLNKQEPNPHAAVFLKWATSQEAMELYAHNNVLTAIKTDIPPPVGYLQDPYPSMIPIDFEKAAHQRIDILKRWDKEFNSKSEAQ